jgi:hypothetical protein
MTRPGKSFLRFALPLLTAAVFVSAFGGVSPSTYAQCPRPGFKLKYGHFAYDTNRIVSADFNADGKADIATAFYSGAQIAVFFGDGAGEFSAPATYPAGNIIIKLVAADVNNDAKPDLILFRDAFSVNNFVSVFLNNGSGVFGAPIESTFHFDPYNAQMGDLNGDGKSDLIYTRGGPSAVAVRFGDGMGNFPAESIYPITDPFRLVLGDFTGDGKLDVGVYVFTFSSMTSKLVTFLNNGSGGLALGTEIVLGNAGVGLARDFNGDGKADMAGISAGNSVMVLMNDGSGGFNRTDYPLGLSTSGIRAGDFNGDGALDLISAGGNYLSLSRTVYGNGSGGFTLGEKFGAAFGWGDQGEVADFNGDGKTDLAVSAPGVRAFLRTCNDVSNTKRIDYDGDGLGDFAVWQPADGAWTIDQSATNTRRTVVWGGGSFGDIPVPGDYDGDGKSDIAVFRAPTGAWYVLRSSDDTLFGMFWGTAGDKPVPGDYDADGKTDLAVFRPANGGWYILKSSDGAFASYAFGLSGDKPAQADFDNDDKTDIAVYRPSEGYWYILRSSNSSFHAEHFGISVDKPIPADYDGDGKADLAVFRPNVGFYFLSTWNNVATGQEDFRYAGNPSTSDRPAPMKRSDAFYTHIRRNLNNIFGGYQTTSSNVIGSSSAIPVVTPYVIE